jgi:hypothetical protein
MKKHLLLIFILSILSICSYAQDATFSTAGAYNITIPPGVTSIRVDAYGGGGGGGGSNSSSSRGGGGGGGAYVTQPSRSVTAGTCYNITVGSGGTAGGTTGTAGTGGESFFIDNSTIRASGGAGGTAGSGGTAGTGGAGATGTVGGTATNGTNGAAGGSGGGGGQGGNNTGVSFGDGGQGNSNSGGNAGNAGAVQIWYSPTPTWPNGSGTWIGYVYNSNIPPGGAAFNNAQYIGTVTEALNFNRTFASTPVGASTSVCSAPTGNFHIRYKMQRTMNNGMYRITAGADDGYRLRYRELPSGAWTTWEINNWADGGYRTTTIVRLFNAADYEFELEYYQGGGGAQVSFDLCQMSAEGTTAISGNAQSYGAGGASNAWHLYYYNRPDGTLNALPLLASQFAGTNRSGSSTATSANLYFNWGTGTPTKVGTDCGISLGGDNFALEARLNNTFTKGVYSITSGADDRSRISINGGTSWLNAHSTNNNPTFLTIESVLSGSTNIIYQMQEGSGDAVANVNILCLSAITGSISISSVNCGTGQRTISFTGGRGYAQLQASTNGGSTWIDIGAEQIATSTSSVLTWSVTPGATTMYRVRVMSCNATENYTNFLYIGGTGNYTGNITIANNTTLSGTLNINGDFTVNNGVTVTVAPGCPLVINATNITINGTINANGAGSTGGNGGSVGTSASGSGCPTISGGGGGAAGNGTGGGDAAGNGTNGGCDNIDCGTVCIGGDDGERSGAGGGGGGGGGSYGGVGGNGRVGAGGVGGGDYPAAGTGGTAGSAKAAYGNATDNAIDMGSGGGGGGGGGGGAAGGSNGGAGGSGGGAISLKACNNLTVAGAVTANGTVGGAGGQGAALRDGSTYSCGCTTGALWSGGSPCRDNSACGACTYYTYPQSGGAGAGGGGGSGGGILLQAFGVASITGTLTANGGVGGGTNLPEPTTNGTCHGTTYGGAGGGGGRIKIFVNPCQSNTVTGSFSASAGNGGTGSGGHGNGNSGSAGTVQSNLQHPSYSTLAAGSVTTSPTFIKICSGSNPATGFSANVSTGGANNTSLACTSLLPAYEYQWYVTRTACGNPTTGTGSTANAGWAAISGVTTQNISALQLLDGINTVGANTTPGVYSFQRRTKSGNCYAWTTVVSVVIFPPVPTLSTLSNTCNSELAGITAVPTIAGFTAEYTVQAPGGSFSTYGTLAAADALTTNTPGCWSFKARYVLTDACGGAAALEAPPAACVESSVMNAVVFPPAPTLTSLSNTCNAALADITAVAPVTGFTAEYAVQPPGGSLTTWGTLSAANTATYNTPGCWTIKARYKLSANCGGTLINSISSEVACQESTINAVVFPSAPAITAISNTCNTKLADISAVTPRTDFTAEYAVQKPGGSLSSYGTLAAANALLDATIGCWTIKARYKLTAACGGTAADATSGTLACQENTIYAVVFPPAPTLTAISNTCNTKLADITAIADLSADGFTAEYAVQKPGVAISGYVDLATANALLDATPGCWTIKARYKLTAACGGTAANATSGTLACQETTINAVVFPAAPTITSLSNTCNAALADITAVAPVTGFTAEYAVQPPGGSLTSWGTLSAANTATNNTPGCWTIKARYKLSANCGGTLINSISSEVACQESTINAVVFPPAPTMTALANTCNTALANITAVAPRTDFTAEYAVQEPGGSLSAYGDLTTANGLLSNTPGCWIIKARYKLIVACGSTAADATSGTIACQESTINAVVFPPAPVITAPSPTCVGTPFVLPTVTAVSGFTVQYSINGGTYSVSPVIPTAAATYTVKARYVLTNACGSTAANTVGTGACTESNTVNAVISPLPIATPTTQLYTCNNSALLLATGISVGTTVSWQYDSGPVLPTGTTTSNPLLVTFSTTGTASYILLGSNSGCSNINLGTINVVLPTVSTTTLATTASCAYCVVKDGNSRLFYNSNGHLIARIDDDPLTSPDELDTTEVCVRMDGSVQFVNDNYGNLQPYLPRQWTIKPVNNSNSLVTLYFTQSELLALQSAANSSVYQFSGYSNLSITKYPGGENGTFTAPATLSGVGMNGSFSSYGSDHKVEFMVNSFSTFYIHPVLFPFAALPVELTSFTGWNQGTVNRLQWVTASELNTSKFVVEKSITQGVWTVIGEKTAAGNSSASLTYDFTDNNPVDGNNYYRLKVVDLDGSFSYSNIINIPVSETVVNNFTRVYPNPTGGLLNVEIQSTEPFDTKIIVYDVLGKKLEDKASSLNKGINTIQFNFSQLANGSYVIQFSDKNGKLHTTKFVKD